MTRAYSRALAIAGLIVATMPGGVSAQRPSIYLDSGVTAYDEVAYDAAARHLRRALAVQGSDSLTAALRSTALMYLGATEFFLQHRDSAVAAFKTLLAYAPRHEPDSLVFPRPITDFFENIRKSVHGVARVRAIDTGVRVTVFAINPHRVTVEVFAGDGRRLRALYAGASADSLSVDWNERADDGKPVSAGRYEIVVTAHGNDGRLLSVARFPVMVERP